MTVRLMNDRLMTLLDEGSRCTLEEYELEYIKACKEVKSVSVKYSDQIDDSVAYSVVLFSGAEYLINSR
jgi:hypothetical protein